MAKQNGTNSGADSGEGAADSGTVATVNPGTVAPASSTPAIEPSAAAGINPAVSGIDPSAAIGIAPKKKRGRPPGSKNQTNLSGASPQVKTAPLSVDGVSAILFSIHGMLAGVTRVKELQLDPAEAKQLASAVAEVAKHYDLTADPKTIAWVNLAMTCGAVYGSRFVAIQFRIKAQRENARKRAPVEQPTDFLNGRLPPMDGGTIQ